MTRRKTQPPLTERQAASFGPRQLKEKGSVPWCWQVLGDLQTKWRHHQMTQEWFDKVLAEVRKYCVWEKVPPEQPYGSLEALLKAELGDAYMETPLPSQSPTTPLDRDLLDALWGLLKAPAMALTFLRARIDDEASIMVRATSPQ